MESAPCDPLLEICNEFPWEQYVRKWLIIITWDDKFGAESSFKTYQTEYG